jgi:hypothetical protein
MEVHSVEHGDRHHVDFDLFTPQGSDERAILWYDDIDFIAPLMQPYRRKERILSSVPSG